MFQTGKNYGQFDALNEEERDMLIRINAYSEQVLGDIDPQKTRISFQLDKLKPIMQEIADEKGVPLEDIFIKYMDLASIVSAKQNAMLKEDFERSSPIHPFPNKVGYQVEIGERSNLVCIIKIMLNTPTENRADAPAINRW